MRFSRPAAQGLTCIHIFQEMKLVSNEWAEIIICPIQRVTGDLRHASSMGGNSFQSPFWVSKLNRIEEN